MNTNWYHGTRRGSAANIIKTGLEARYYGRSYQGTGWLLHTLARDRHQVELPGRDTVIVFGLSDDEVRKYLTCADGSPCCHGHLSGLLLPLPRHLICRIEDLAGHPIALA